MLLERKQQPVLVQDSRLAPVRLVYQAERIPGVQPLEYLAEHQKHIIKRAAQLLDFFSHHNGFNVDGAMRLFDTTPVSVSDPLFPTGLLFADWDEIMAREQDQPGTCREWATLQVTTTFNDFQEFMAHDGIQGPMLYDPREGLGRHPNTGLFQILDDHNSYDILNVIELAATRGMLTPLDDNEQVIQCRRAHNLSIWALATAYSARRYVDIVAQIYRVEPHERSIGESDHNIPPAGKLPKKMRHALRDEVAAYSVHRFDEHDQLGMMQYVLGGHHLGHRTAPKELA